MHETQLQKWGGEANFECSCGPRQQRSREVPIYHFRTRMNPPGDSSAPVKSTDALDGNDKMITLARQHFSLRLNAHPVETLSCDVSRVQPASKTWAAG